MILSFCMYEKTCLHGSLEGEFEGIQVSSLVVSTRSLDGWIYFSKLFTKREREDMREFPQGLHEPLELWSFSSYL